MEYWKMHPNFPINVSSKGRVKNLMGKLLKNSHNNRGYYKCSIYRSVHRLVAQTFLSNPEKKPCVNHKDGNKLNNNVENLEWVTYSENFLHALEMGLNPNGKGANNPRSKKIKQIDPKTQNVIKIFNSTHEVQRETGFNQGNISHIVNKPNRTAYGYKWEYA